MNTASFDLCKELHELSGWEGNDRWYMTNISDPDDVIGTATPRIHRHDVDYQSGYRTDTPAYNLGYLLRKLPVFYEESKTPFLLTIQPNPIGSGWQAHYRLASFTPNSRNVGSRFRQEADTPENAVCKLAIELFKQGVLKA